MQELHKNGVIWCAESPPGYTTRKDKSRLQNHTENLEHRTFTETLRSMLLPASLHTLNYKMDALHSMISPRLLTPHSFILHVLQSYLEGHDDEGAIVWIGEDIRPTPHMLMYANYDQHGAALRLLERSLFIDCNTSAERAWTMQHALSSKGVAVVIAGFTEISSPLTRRFLLAAQKQSTLGVLITPYSKHSDRLCVHSQWTISNVPTSKIKTEQSGNATPSTHFQVHLRRARGSLHQIRTWHVRCNYDHQFSLHSLRPVVNRSLSEATLPEAIEQKASCTG